jgi:O-antigen/teichoic acid export membrane protein
VLKFIKISFRDSLIFGFGNVAVKVIGLILIPLYTNPDFFSVDDFGLIGLLDVTGLVILSVFTSFLPQSLARWYWAKDNTLNQKELFFMTFGAQLIMSTLFCLMLIPFSGQISAMILKKEELSQAVTFIILASAIQGINNLINSLLRLQSRSMLFMTTNLVKLLIVLVLTILFIIQLKMGIAGIYLAQVIGNSVIILGLIPYTIKNSSPGFDKSTLKEMTIYGLPLVLASFASVMLNVIDRYALNSMAILTYVAIYSLAAKLSSTLKLVLVDTIKLAVFPQMIRRIESSENKRFYSKTLLYSSFIVMAGIVGVSLFSPEIIKILSGNTELWSSYLLVPVLSLSIFFVNMREVSIYGLIVKKKTSRISIIIFTSAIFGLALNILFIPMWQAMGAALATLIAQLFYWSLLHFTAQRTYFIPYENRKIVIMFFTGALLSFSGMLVNDASLLPRILLKLVFLASFPVILYFLDFYEKAEIEAIKGFARKWSVPGKFRENLRSLINIQDELN